MSSRHTKPPQTGRSPVRQRTAELRDRLLNAATELFLRQGFDGPSMGEIAAHAGASKETFYRHFPTKEDLFRAVITRLADRTAEEFSAALLKEETLEVALTHFGEFLLDRVTEPGAIAMRRVLAAEKERFPDLRKFVRDQARARVIGPVCRYLEDQVAAGHLRKLDTNVAAGQFFDLVAAEMIMSATFGNLEKPTKAAMRQRVQEAVSCFLHGYAAPSH